MTKAIQATLVEAMEAYFGQDTKRIHHAHKVTEYAEKLLKPEGGDYPIVIAAALLHDIGIHEAERKYNSTAGKYQEKEGPPIAYEILSRLDFSPQQIEEICQIIGHHHSPGVVNTTNFKILYDSDWLVNLKDEYPTEDKRRLRAAIEKLFLTNSGKALAREIYLTKIESLFKEGTMNVKLDPIVEFRQDHRKVRDSLLDLASAAEARDVSRAREILGQIDAMVGPHFRYEEETLYPALKEFLGDYVDSLIKEHDGAVETARIAAKLLSQSALSLEEGKEVAKAARALLIHVSNCDGLNILAERFSQEKLDGLAGHYAQSRAEGVPLLRWADTIRKEKH